MTHSQKVKISGLLLLAVMSIGVFVFTPLSAFWAHVGVHAASSLPYHEFANGPYSVKGNTIVGADGTQYLFHGVGRDSLEFDCSGDGFLDSAHLAFMGPGTSGSSGTYWYANTVRVPVSEGFWLHGDSAQTNCTPANYQTVVKNTINNITALKLNVILDLMWTDAGGQDKGAGAGYELPDSDSQAFWSQAAKVYAGYSNVLFEVYNEPHPPSFACWAAGCAITQDNTNGAKYNYTGVSIQSLVSAVRGAGANNVALVAGINWGFDLSQLSAFPITGTNVVYDSHPYPYSGKNTTAEWDAAFGYLTSKYPVMSAEFGEYDGQSSFESMAVNYFDQHSMGWIAWAWYSTGGTNAQQIGYPQLVSNYNGTPLANMGTYIHQQLLSYANIGVPSPTPTLPPVTGPVSKVWYFAEGRVGAGFNEFLTLGNPTANDCQVSITYLTQPDSGTGGTKTVAVDVPPGTRVTRWVDSDLGTSTMGNGISDAATVSVNSAASPTCSGIVAERPMYFNAKIQGTNSGSDVVGVTHTNTTFYFADMAVGTQPGGGFYSSYLPILNPGTAAANVTATYFVGGLKVGTQTLTVAANSRGTIFPSQASPHLPPRVSVVLTSTQPVVSERPTYFSGINGGNAGIVSGGADVIGVQQLATDWLFAEGYTGGHFQENFVLANLDPASKPATVTITLEYNGGASKAFTVTVNALSQVIWNVNANSTGTGTSQSVSAEITSTGAKIAVEREMYFGYDHVGDGRTTQAMGGTDVLGEVGPAAVSDYSFAEGYTNLGYDEWLTIQNPTANTETVNATVSNGVGTVYTFAVQVVGHSRYTVDMVAIVQQHVFHGGNGYQGYEISMAVQSSNGPFVVERPMYWNASGTQGGSDVIGYAGG
jgi:endoglucanase